jgi:hypothetical protein
VGATFAPVSLLQRSNVSSKTRLVPAVSYRRVSKTRLVPEMSNRRFPGVFAGWPVGLSPNCAHDQTQARPDIPFHCAVLPFCFRLLEDRWPLMRCCVDPLSRPASRGFWSRQSRDWRRWMRIELSLFLGNCVWGDHIWPAIGPPQRERVGAKVPFSGLRHGGPRSGACV